MSKNRTIDAAEAWKSADKRHFVMAHALDLIVEVGYQGLTMRGIADRSGMSLSNVQYYFRTKEDLVTEIADRYFGECATVLATYFTENGPIRTRAGLQGLVELFLDHGREMTDMCRVFRELWAIGSRNEEISVLIDRHYKRFGDTVRCHLEFPSADIQSLDRVISLLLVISEGYSIVGSSQPMDHNQAVSFFTDMLICAAERTGQYR